MTLGALCVARPQDDVGVLEHAAATIASASRDLLTQRDALEAAGGRARASWVGDAAIAFIGAEEAGLGHLATMSNGHEQLAEKIEDYRRQLAAANAASARALAHISQAIQDHNSAATRSADQLEQHITRLWNQAQHEANQAANDLSNFNLIGAVEHGYNAVADAAQAAADKVEQLGSALDQLQSWSPTPLEPVLVPQGITEPVAHWAASQVTSALESLGNFFVSTVMDGFSALINFGDELIHGAISLIRHAEHAIADAIATAQKWVSDAIDDLIHFATDIARTIGTAVVDTLKFVWHLGEAFVDGTLTVLHVVADLTTIIGSVALLGLEKELGINEGPRLPQAELDRIDNEAATNYNTNQSVRDGVEVNFDLARAVYSEPADPASMPPGWHEVRPLYGPDGGHAALFKYDGPPAKYIVAFQGTDPNPFTSGDDAEDAANAAGLPTPQGEWATQIARQYGGPPFNATFTGHSLGGSLAAIASMTSGQPAVTFNAAGVGDGNYALASHAHGGPVTETQITNYHTEDDSITTGQQALGLRPASGAQVTMTGHKHGFGSYVTFQTHDTSDFTVNPDVPDSPFDQSSPVTGG